MRVPSHGPYFLSILLFDFSDATMPFYLFTAKNCSNVYTLPLVTVCSVAIDNEAYGNVRREKNEKLLFRMWRPLNSVRPCLDAIETCKRVKQ